jgi:hypothetical protein
MKNENSEEDNLSWGVFLRELEAETLIPAEIRQCGQCTKGQLESFYAFWEKAKMAAPLFLPTAVYLNDDVYSHLLFVWESNKSKFRIGFVLTGLAYWSWWDQNKLTSYETHEDHRLMVEQLPERLYDLLSLVMREMKEMKDAHVVQSDIDKVYP